MVSLRVCWCGQLGSMKTTGAVKEAYRYSLNHPDSPIFSNVVLKGDLKKNYHPIKSVRELFELDEPCFLLLDEVWYIADSRSFQSPENHALGVLLLRSRKKDWTVAFTQQWYTQLDLRLRYITDLWIFPQSHLLNTVIQEDIYDLHANFIGQRFCDATPFFEMFDSYKDPTTLDIDFELARYDKKHSVSRY